MSKDVRVPQHTLLLLGGLLVASLLAIGFLIGKQSSGNSPEQVPASPARPNVATQIPMAEPAEQTLDSRVGALEDRVGTLQQASGTQPNGGSSIEMASPPPSSADDGDLEARLEYFKQLDAILGSSALTSPQPFATRLLEQAMMGDDTQLSSVLANTRQAAHEVDSIEPPPSCKEHKKLVLAQLSHAVTLLEQVQAATRAGETAKLNTLPLPNDTAMAENLRLQKLDQALRPL